MTVLGLSFGNSGCRIRCTVRKYDFFIHELLTVLTRGRLSNRGVESRIPLGFSIGQASDLYTIAATMDRRALLSWPQLFQDVRMSHCARMCLGLTSEPSSAGLCEIQIPAVRSAPEVHFDRRRLRIACVKDMLAVVQDGMENK